MPETKQVVSISRKLLFIPIIIIAILIAKFIVGTRKKPAVKKGQEVVASVETLKIKKVTIVPQAIGYGHIVPAKVWKAIAQVSGRIIWQDNALNNGAFYKKGAELLRIDDIPLKLAVDKARAEVAKSQATLAELIASEKNANQTLKIREKMVLISSQELERKKALLKKKLVSSSDVDKEELSVLNQKNSLQQTKTELSILPEKIIFQSSSVKAAEANLAQALLNLSYSSVKAPFDCRIAKVNSEILQYGRVGEELLTADWVEKFEVEAQIDAEKFMLLMNSSENNQEKEFSPSKNMKAIISYKSGQNEFQWIASIDRIDSEIDLDTRTVGVVVSADDTFGLDKDLQKTPLIKGMFCSISIFGKQKENVVVVPRASIHGDKVYVMDADKRLRFKTIKTDFNLFNYSVIELGLKEGEELITTDVIPAISGMLLSATPIENYYEKLDKSIGLSSLSQQLLRKSSIKLAPVVKPTPITTKGQTQ